MTEVEEKSWELSLYESLRTPQEAITDSTGWLHGLTDRWIDRLKFKHTSRIMWPARVLLSIFLVCLTFEDLKNIDHVEKSRNN